MKRIIFCIVLLLADHAGHAQESVDFILEKLKSPTEEYVLLGAHRGDWRNEPENSLAAIQRCIDLGLDIVEIDLRKTKDGQLILMHDKTLDRTTTGKGKVSEHTWEEISRLYLKNPIGVATRQKVPTLRQALQLTKGKILVFLDKAENYIPELTAVLDSMRMHEEIILFGREQLSYEALKSRFGNLVHTAVFIPVLKSSMTHISAYIAALNENIRPLAYALDFDEQDTSVLNYTEQIRKGGSKIWFSTLWASLCGGHDDELSMLHPEEGWGWVLKNHTGIILTDRPGDLKEYLQKHNRHSKNNRWNEK